MSEDKPDLTRSRAPHNHRTVDRVTQILEAVVYNPGMTFAEIARESGAAKSSAYGFVNGLLARGWLYEENHRYYLGPAVFALTMASGHIRAGLVSHDDLVALHEETGEGVFLGVKAGEELIYIEEAGSGDIGGFEARSNIRRRLLGTAGGKILLAAQPDPDLEIFLRRQRAVEPDLVEQFLSEFDEIRSTGFAQNESRAGARLAIATSVRDRNGNTVASIILVGQTREMSPRIEELRVSLAKHSDLWSQRRVTAREAI